LKLLKEGIHAFFNEILKVIPVQEIYLSIYAYGMKYRPFLVNISFYIILRLFLREKRFIKKNPFI
jgi:hypothetical protein